MQRTAQPWHLPLTAAALLFTETGIGADPFPNANLEQGQAFHDELCVACHTRRFGGEEGSGAYLRENRRVKSPDALTQMLTACTTNLRLELFPEDEYHIAGYLNRRFYRFGLE